MIHVCTSSTEVALASLGDLMVLLGSTASSSGLDTALTAASRWVERHITNSQGGCITRSVVRETLPGYGSQSLMLTRTPVLAVAHLFDATDTGLATEYCSTDFRIEDPEAGLLTRTDDLGFQWTPGVSWNIESYPRPATVTRPWLVDYEAGWQLTPSTSTDGRWLASSTDRTLPEDVERAVLLKAAEFAQGSNRGIEMMQVGPLRVNYGSEALDPVIELLAPYRRLT